MVEHHMAAMVPHPHFQVTSIIYQFRVADTAAVQTTKQVVMVPAVVEHWTEVAADMHRVWAQ
jgi:hypothetical protein